MNFDKIRCIFFDFDGTLYDHYFYFDSAFKKISSYLARRLKMPKKQIEKELWDILKKKGSTYPRLFDDFLEQHDIFNKKLVGELVKLFYSAPVDNLEMYLDAKEFILNAISRYKLGIITEGSRKKQIRRIRKLGLEKLMDAIIYAQDMGLSKLNPSLFKHALSLFDVAPRESMYIGDNPNLDFVVPNRLGMLTVRLMRSEFKRVKVNERKDAKIRINSFRELEKIMGMRCNR